jgi:hypothetical protein
MIQIVKIKYDRETKEEELVPLHINISEITCLYKDRKGVFIVTKQGFMHKVPYKLENIRDYLGM